MRDVDAGSQHHGGLRRRPRGRDGCSSNAERNDARQALSAAEEAAKELREGLEESERKRRAVEAESEAGREVIASRTAALEETEATCADLSLRFDALSREAEARFLARRYETLDADGYPYRLPPPQSRTCELG